jgi:hypothetical protein
MYTVRLWRPKDIRVKENGNVGKPTSSKNILISAYCF